MIFVTMSSPPTKSAPESWASRTFSPLAITRTRTALPSPCGRTTVPRTTWSECLGSTPRLMASSTVSLNLVWCVFLISSVASASLYGRASTFLRAFSTFLPDFFIAALVTQSLRCYFQAHIPRCAHHRTHCRFHVRGIQIDQLQLGDLFHLLLGHFADFIAIRFRGPLYNARRAQQQNRSRRRLQNKSESSIRINRNQHRENHAVRLFGRLGIELLAEIHNVQAVRTERRADWRRRSRFT